MKYAKEFESVLKNYPLYERVFLINYKKWKKIKTPDPHWKTKLSLKLFMTPTKKLLDTNLKTAYKICKRFEKRNLCGDSKSFYTMVSKIVSSKASLTSLESDFVLQ